MAHKNKVEVALDLSVLPQKANHIIDWDRSIDIAIPFNCEDIHGYIYIIDMYYCTKKKQRRFLIQYHGKQKWIYHRVDQAISNLTKMICEDYNDGYSFQDLKHKYHLGCTGIRNAIKRGEEIGWCRYIADIDKYAPIDVYYHDNYIFSGICASDVANTLQQKYHIKATKNMINGRIRNGTDLNGYSFIRIKNSKRAREVICNAG